MKRISETVYVVYSALQHVCWFGAFMPEVKWFTLYISTPGLRNEVNIIAFGLVYLGFNCICLVFCFELWFLIFFAFLWFV